MNLPKPTLRAALAVLAAWTLIAVPTIAIDQAAAEEKSNKFPAYERSENFVERSVEGRHPQRVIDQLREGHGIVTTRSPYGSKSVRASPGLHNTPEDVDRLLEAVRTIV